MLALGRELDTAIHNLGLSYAAVGRDIGLSAVQVARVAHGTTPGLTILQASELLAAVGLALSARTYPSGRPLRDVAHVRLLAQFRTRLHRSLVWRTEVPVAGRGDLRAWDGLVAATDWRVGVEAETRLRDWQEMARRLGLKARDGDVSGVILLVAATRGNQLALRELGDTVRSTFPVPGRRALELLAAGVDPGGSALIVL